MPVPEASVLVVCSRKFVRGGGRLKDQPRVIRSSSVGGDSKRENTVSYVFGSALKD